MKKSPGSEADAACTSGRSGGGAACLAATVGGGVTPENALPIATTTSALSPKSLIAAGRSTDAVVSPSERRSFSAERCARRLV